MVASFTGYADDINHVISNFYIQRSKFAGNSDKLGGNSENNWTPNGSWGSFFPTTGTLGT